MKTKSIIFGAVALLLLTAQPVLAAEHEGVFLPGWFAWLMVALAIGTPIVLLLYLRDKGQL